MYKKIGSFLLSVSILTASFANNGAVFAQGAQNQDFPSAESLLMAPLTQDGYLIDSLQLPQKTANGEAITWQSSEPDIISASGNVTRPEDANEVVTLTAQCQGVSQPYTFTVASLISKPAGMPKLEKLVRADEFDDDSIDTKYIQTKLSGGLVSESDGALIISRTKASGDLWAAINADAQAISGRYMLEYILEATAAKQICSRLYGGDGSNIASIDILANGAISYWSRPSSDASGSWGSIAADSSRMPRVKMSVFVDTDTQSYSLWLNNKIVIDNHYFRASASSVSNMRLWLNSTDDTALLIKSFKLYKGSDAIIEDDGEAVLYDKNNLNDSDFLMAPLADGQYLIDSLSLPTAGKNETQIRWKSSDTSVISDKGYVTRPKSEVRRVTMQASVTRGQAVATRDFYFDVAPLSLQIAGMPKLQSVVYADEFDSSQINEAFIKPLASGGTVVQEDGALVISRFNTGGDAGANFYFNSAKLPDTGKFMLEYIVERTSLTQVATRLFGDASQNTIALDWTADGGFSYWKRPLAEEAGGWGNIAADAKRGADVKLSISIDTDAKTYSVWADNEKIIDNYYFRANETSAHFMRFYLTDANHTSLKIKSCRIYRVWTDMSDDQRVTKDADALSLPDILDMQDIIAGKATAQFDLASSGIYASDIEWSSSDDVIISSDGTIHRQSGEGVDEVVLTAHVSFGTAQRKKQFVVHVPQMGVVVSDKPLVKEMIVENDFSNDLSSVHNIALGGTTSTDRYEYVDGRLEAERLSTNSNQTYVSLSPYKYYSDDYVVRGTVGVELTIGRKEEKTLAIRFKGTGGDDYLAMTWFYGGWITLTHSDAPGQSAVNYELPGSYKNEIKVLALFDTQRSMYSLWINDKLVMENKYSRVSGVNAFRYVTVWNEGESFFTYTLDDFKVYHAIPPTKNILEYDSQRLTQKSILNETPLAGNRITGNLNLYTDLPFGSKITWKSDKPDVINPQTGEVVRAPADGNDEAVKLTAIVSYCGKTFEREFDFVVLRQITDKAQQETADFEALEYSILTSQNPAQLTEALNLIDKGMFGSDISWESSAPDIIGPSGRVVRPRWNEASQSVTLTATIGGKYKKSFEFTVAPDELLSDPYEMSDEDFFGVYANGSWSKSGVLDYGLEGMSQVGEAVKSGDYQLAKERLFSRMRTRNVKSPSSLSTRKTNWVDMLVCEVADMQSDDYYATDCAIDSGEYAQYSIYMENPNVKTSCTKSFNLIAKHNDATHVLIAGNDYPDESMRPYMVLNVNGSRRTYPAMSAATVRAGDYADSHYDDKGELKVKMFGDFLGDETYRTIMEFNFDDIEAGDTVTDGELVIYAKKSNSYSEPKELFVLRDNNAGWNEDTLTWNSLVTYVHNFNGIDGGITWENVRKSDVEYWHQSARFDGSSQLVTEYLYTEDEVYMYHLIHRMMDFVVDCEAVGPNVLDTACRMEEWVKVFNYIVQSHHMNADMCTAIIKNMYMAMEAIKSSSSTTANWIQTEKLNAYFIASLFPEFANSREVSSAMISDFTDMIKKDFYGDGSYVEDTVGYNALALTSYISLKQSVINAGGTMPKEYDDILGKAAKCVLLMYGPNGEALGYGDSNPGGWRVANVYKNVSEWANDSELLFIDSFGKEGSEPQWTSAHYPDSTYTVMRSDWGTDAMYLMTNVRNGGTHNHNDDNSIIAFANGRMLLTDPGWGTYTAGESRDYARSTYAHNSVEINGETSKTIEDNYTITTGSQGEIHNWITNDSYDFLSQSSTGYTHIDNTHRRSITFIKPDMWIVSDLMTPKDKSFANSYKQTWHMLPTANVKIEATDGKIRSDFADGASNLVIVSADSDAQTKEDVGGYTVAYGNMTDVPFGYFEKVNATGDTTFDTVLLPYTGTNGDANVERINLGVPSSDATAMKIVTNVSGNEQTVYYMLSYAQPQTRVFGKYQSDGVLSVVCEDETGSVGQIILTAGTMVADSSGNIVLSTGGIKVDDICVEVDGFNLNIYSSDADIDISKLKFTGTSHINNVLFNGEYKKFSVKDGVISVNDEAGSERLESDKNANLGIKDNQVPADEGSGSSEAPSGGSQAPSGGGSSGSGAVGGVNQPSSGAALSDIGNHWAYQYINTLHQRGSISGYADGTFKPDQYITRAEFVSLVVRCFNLPSIRYDGAFADVSAEAWYADHVMSALRGGVISADITFRPNDLITRQEMSKIISCVLVLAGKEAPGAEFSAGYDDYSSVSEWAREYVDFVSFYGYMNGRDGNLFAPDANTTRAETATVLSRALN